MNQSNYAKKRPSATIAVSYISAIFAVLAMIIFSVALLMSNKITPRDTTPPVISGASDITIYTGEAPAYRKNISLWDDSSQDVSLTIDSTAVDMTSPGRYPVTYTATDAAGNSSSVTIYLTIELYFPQEAELTAALDSVISQIIHPSMNTEQKVRAIYSYVQANISFVDTSDKSNWKAEAYKSLFVTNIGDCFSFFAASKAFFERLGIDNIDIQRPQELAQQMNQTHYWSLVNISDTPGQEIWYHFDSCRLRSEYNHSGCLLTTKQIEAYNYVRENFYAHDKTLLPNVCDTIITPTPELEEFYNKNEN